MIRFESTGSPRQRGICNGRTCRALGIKWLEKALSEADKSPGAQSAGLRWMEQAQTTLPELGEEIAGISEGLGVPLDDYIKALFANRLRQISTACSTFGGMTPDGHPVLAKTDDILASQRGMNVLQFAYPNNGQAHAKFHFGGTPMVSAGLNAAGLSVALTGIPGPNVEEVGVPGGLYLVNHLLLKCASVAEALEALSSLPINSYGCSLLMADRKGNITLVEKNALGTSQLPPTDKGWFLHTNHILDSRMAAASPPPGESLQVNSLARHQLLCRLTTSRPPSLENLEWMLGQGNESLSIIQKAGAPLETDYAFVASPADDIFKLWADDPATTPPFQILPFSKTQPKTQYKTQP